MNQVSKNCRLITIKKNNQARTIRVESLSRTRTLAKKFVKELHGGDVLALSGNLGSGKTTFTQMVARVLGIKESVTSPTFVLMKLYSVKKSLNSISQLCHIDAYRLESSVELQAIGGLEYIAAPGTLTVIEWSEKVKNMIPKNAIWISFELGDKV